MSEDPKRDQEWAPEELDSLRELWDRTAIPEAPDELSECDARTRAAVLWMRSAWEDLEVPVRKAELGRDSDPGSASGAAHSRLEPSTPGRVHGEPRRGSVAAFPQKKLLPWLAVAAALVLAWLGWGAVARPVIRVPDELGERVASAGSAPDALPSDDPPQAVLPEHVESPNSTESSSASAAGARIESLVSEVGASNLEFRSGSVRLVLVIDAGNG